MKTSNILFILLMLAVIALLAYFASFERQLPGILKQQSGLNMTVGHAKLRMGPKIILEDVHIPQPAGYPAGDALVIKQVVIDMDHLNEDSMIVHSVTATGITGNLAYNNTVDNFTALQQILDQSYHEVPKDSFWGKPAVVQTVQVRQVSLTSGTATALLPDRNSQPVGTAQNPLPLKKAYMMSIAKILENERQGIAPATVEKVKGDLNQLIESGTENVKNFIDAVTSKMTGTVGEQPRAPVPSNNAAPAQPPSPHPQDAVTDKMTRDQKVQGSPSTPPVGQPPAPATVTPASPQAKPQQAAPNAAVVPPPSNTKVP